MKIWNYSAILATTATAAQVADIQSAYLTHATPETRAKDTSLHGCNCKFLNDASYTAGPVYNGSNVDWLCRGWRLARGCVLGQDTICGANANPEYEFSGDCNAITGDNEVCQKALCNLDKHFAQELHVLANDAQWTADQIYTDADNPGVCGLQGLQRTTTNKCCVTATGVYTYLQQNHASHFENQCILPIETGNSTPTTAGQQGVYCDNDLGYGSKIVASHIHCMIANYTEDPVGGFTSNGNVPSQLASFEQDGIIYHGGETHSGNSYMEGFFANDLVQSTGTVAKYYVFKDPNSAEMGQTEMIWPFEYQGTNYIATVNTQTIYDMSGSYTQNVIHIYKRDEPNTPHKRFIFPEARTVKVRGIRFLACSNDKCCLTNIPTLLAEHLLSDTYYLFSDYVNGCYNKDTSNIVDADFDSNYVWISDHEKLRIFELNMTNPDVYSGSPHLDSSQLENDSTVWVYKNYWIEVNDCDKNIVMVEDILFIICYSRGTVLIADTTNRYVKGFYKHTHKISTFKISNGLFMFTDNRQVDVDDAAQQELGNLFIHDLEHFMATARFFSHLQVPYDISLFLIHEVDGKNLGRARSIEISGDSVFVLLSSSPSQFDKNFGKEIRRFTFFI